VLSRGAAYKRLIDDFVDLLGGSAAPVMAHLVDAGKLTLADVKEVEKALAKREKKS
jgi:predicted transcriptional regulator